MPYSELIKSFQRIRPYIRSFYVYGFRHRLEHDEKSARSYDNERRRLESWLGDYMKFGQDTDGKRVFLSVDSRAIPSNPLYQAFKAKSFTDLDIMLHFSLLDMLGTEHGLCMAEVLDQLEKYLKEFPDLSFPDESSVREKLKEYEKLGLVHRKKQGKKVYYYLAEAGIDLSSWTDALAFFKEAAPLGVIGSYMQEAQPSCFRYKHHYMLNALDSEILYALFDSMGEGKTAILNNGRMTAEIIPLKIYISTQSGRQYVLGKSKQGFQFYRLDLLDSVKMGETAAITEKLQVELCEFQSRVWGVSKKNTGRTEHLEFVVHADPDEAFVVQRLHREKRTGTVTELGNGNWQFSADVFDAMEILPWVRTFIGRIISLETDNLMVQKRFHEDLAALSQLYGGDEDAVL